MNVPRIPTDLRSELNRRTGSYLCRCERYVRDRLVPEVCGRCWRRIDPDLDDEADAMRLASELHRKRH